jgi:hypothetical protein
MLSPLRGSVEPRSEELSAIRLRHRNFLLDTRIFSEQISLPTVTQDNSGARIAEIT